MVARDGVQTIPALDEILHDYPARDPELDAALCLRVQRGGLDGRAAMDELLRRHVRLAMKIARKMHGMTSNAFDFDDRFSICCAEMIQAARTFKVDRGAQFVTWAATVIENNLIRRWQEVGYPIRQPAKHHYDRWRVNKIRQRQPDAPLDAILKELGISRKYWNEVVSAAAFASGELDRPIGHDGDRTLADVLPDRQRQVIHPRRKIIFDWLDEHLPTRRHVISVKLHFGFIGDGEHNFRQIAERIGTSNEMARLYVRNSLSIMRQHRDELARLLETIEYGR